MRRYALVPALFLAATPAAGAQPAPEPPIAIDECVVTINSYYPFPYPARALHWVTTSGLRIAFHDRATGKAAGAIRFLVNYRGDVESIDDVGTFSPGVEIRHSYPQFVDFAYLGTRPNFCRVEMVKFGDGTTWTNESVRPQAR